jgi:hypothetical protein
MNDNRAASMAWNSPAAQGQKHQRWPIVDVIAGAVLVLALNVAAAVGVLLLAVGGASLLLRKIREAQQGATGVPGGR